MKTEIKKNEELKLMNTALTEKEVEQVSGGIEEIVGVPYDTIVKVLKSVKSLILSFEEKPMTLTQFLKWIEKNHEKTYILIQAESRTVADVYAKMDKETRKSYWSVVW